jgi:hypothetical protein
LPSSIASSTIACSNFASASRRSSSAVGVMA